MHAFMATVLLRMAGLDTLDGNAEPQPPHSEPTQVEESIGRGERHAVVGANGLGQAALLKQARKGSKGSLLFDFQQIAFFVEETGECGERRLGHEDGEAERFYRD